jgi:periplasmic divalent cation tolerance protein
MTDAIVVLTTTGSQEEAAKIAQALVERQLAACVQITGPITSVYRWQEKIENSLEWLCVIKSSRANYAALEAAIRELHSYEVPEIIALPVQSGSADYLSWLAANIKP